MQNQNTKLYQAAAGLLPLLAGISMLILPFVTGAGRYGALLPLLLAAAVLAAPLWIPSAVLVRRLKDKAFSRTVHFGVRFALTPLVLLGWGLVFFLCLPAGAAAAAFLLAAASHTLLYEGLERGRILLSDIRLAFGHADLRETFSRIRTNALKTTSKETIIT